MDCSIPVDLVDARAGVETGTSPAAMRLEACAEAAAGKACVHAFLHPSFDTARVVATEADRRVARGQDAGRLGGLAVSVKDLFDISGEVTAAGSVVLADAPAAVADATAVARLRHAGAALVGRTNMSEFAFSGVGINPHHGTPVNAATFVLDAAPRIPGGSSSGGATSVASGAAWAALGSDTGGSIRIPAALQGLVGFKSTARLVPTDGAVPLSTTLDTVSAMTRSVRDAIVMHEILAERTVHATRPALRDLRFAVPTTVMTDGLDAVVARAFSRALSRIAAAGARIEDVDLSPLADAAGINAGGGFSAAESWAWHRRLLVDHGASYDPRVALRIRRGESMSAADYIDLVAARRAWIVRMEAAMAPFDVMLSPTVPIVPPLLAPLVDDDAAFFVVNGALLRNPSLVNLLDGCALSMPCHGAGELPVGLMLWAPAMHDDALLGAALAVEAALMTATDARSTDAARR